MRLTLYIADRRKNQMMAAVDLCPTYKVFVYSFQHEIERKGNDSDKAFISRIISQSKTQKDYWVPAVAYNGLLYADEGIREISDGNRIIFVPQEVTA